ncbi:D-glycero-D-mannoheptose-1,7-bisphosphate phosphatase [Syntrophotalea carbinolica DSM 2380]|uniref:D,D-heptose 1,7-bisphosphate phosphatase n=1 Tax=Syntrophotalea carbinolica (strain DSM 2380 / NBRC 103641 / GraBd1) TaxID=338963 RepID=Q3A525_SYNC1|nr:D-glycero-beta-D-manno-heptose 1,7-bisphosphate 7-phosphatase [Syntrophotalea carbinolica]ABA88532.1 D-glycero-D-mannoheptose-1,7-bisphosphate phosphatase [Syntrophotalea carbinolica DSM 2380]
MSRGEAVAPRKAVFLDRDGTVNVEKNYLHRVEDFTFIPGVPQAIRRLNDAGFLVVVVTNQSGVARGYFELDDVHRLHNHIGRLLISESAHIDGFFICPHHPEAGQGQWRKRCDCRKGEPGLLLQAAEQLNIDLHRSFMVGDKPADMDAGRRAGCTPLLVLTGYGAETAQSLDPSIGRYASLVEAVDFILRQGGSECFPPRPT